MKFLLLICFAVSWHVPSYAQTPLEAYETIRIGQVYKNYMNGVGKGLFWANAALHNRGSQRLYCQPDNVELNRDNYLEVVDRYIATHRNELSKDFPLELVLLQALVEKFPCK
jgi:hypothetical protein